MTSPLPKKLDVFRPPLVWNFPIERVIDMKNALLLKDERNRKNRNTQSSPQHLL